MQLWKLNPFSSIRSKNISSRSEALASLAAFLKRQERIAEEHARTTQGELNFALEQGLLERAQELFEVTTNWRRLERCLKESHPALGSGLLTFVVTAWFLRDLIQHLVRTADEDITYVSGESVGHLRALSRICPLRLRKQSVVYAEAGAHDCSNVEMEINAQGEAILAMAHSHPGRGPESTRPSGIDISYLGKIQKHGSEAIGIIVNRTGDVRFFTVSKPFRVIVTGNGVTQYDQETFRIALALPD